jgi:hypothetical protein
VVVVVVVVVKLFWSACMRYCCNMVVMMC